MTAWNGPDLAETPFDLRLLDWLRDNPDRSAHQIAVSLGLTDPHNRQAQQVVEAALKRLKLRSLVRSEDRLSPTSRLVTRYWSAAPEGGDMMDKCPNCQSELLPPEPVCQDCGAILDAEDAEYARQHGDDDLETGHTRDPEGDEAAHG